MDECLLKVDVMLYFALDPPEGIGVKGGFDACSVGDIIELNGPDQAELTGLNQILHLVAGDDLRLR